MSYISVNKVIVLKVLFVANKSTLKEIELMGSNRKKQILALNLN